MKNVPSDPSGSGSARNEEGVLLALSGEANQNKVETPQPSKLLSVPRPQTIFASPEEGTFLTPEGSVSQEAIQQLSIAMSTCNKLEERILELLSRGCKVEHGALTVGVVLSSDEVGRPCLRLKLA